MNTNQTSGISPWKMTSSKYYHVTESCDQNMNSDLKEQDQKENGISGLVLDMNDRNSVDSPTTHFTIRSSVSRHCPGNNEIKTEQNNQDGDESERINFSAAFNMFESSTLSRGNKNRRNFTVSKHSSARGNETKKGKNGHSSDSAALKSPSVHNVNGSNYYTLPNSPKKSSATIVLSPSNDHLNKNVNTHLDSKTSTKENADLASPKTTLSSTVTIRTVPHAVFRSHGGSIVPSPPPQASFSPSNNIQWPLVNKSKYTYSPAKKTQGFDDKSPDEVREPSTWRQALSPVSNSVIERLDSSRSEEPKQTVTSSPKSEREVLNDNDVSQNGITKSSPTSETIKTSPVLLKSEHKTMVHSQSAASSQINFNEKTEVATEDKKNEIHVTATEDSSSLTERLTTNKLPSSPANERKETSLSPLISRHAEVSSQKPVDNDQTSQLTIQQIKTNEQTNELTKEKEVTKPHANGVTEEEDIDEANLAPMKSAVVTSSVTNGVKSVAVLQTEEEFTDDEKIKDKLTLKNWDPRPLLEDLYQVKLEPDVEDEFCYINMEGYMEKLPTNKKKATLLKTWKRRYFKTKEGKLYYFETRQHAQEAELCLVEAETAYWEENSSAGEKASAYFQMMGGSVEELGGRMLGIDDGRGRYLVVRCPTDKEYSDWLKSLNSQINGRIESTFVKPLLSCAPQSDKKIVVIDIGSCSVRAGILGEKPSLPSVFFPTVFAMDKNIGEQIFGIDCYRPDVRATSTISSPVRPTNRMDKSVDMSVMSGLFRKIYNELGVNPKKYWVMFSAPGNLSDKLKEQFMNILIKEYLVPGVNIVNQTLLALYSYNAKTGIVVDIGDRLEIVPITDGYVAEGGVTRQPYGGHRVAEALKGALTERKYHFFTEAEYSLVRLIMEKLCFISEDFNHDLMECNQDPKYFLESLSLEGYNLPEGYAQEISLDWGRFKAPEGLFNTEVWGMDNPPLQKLVQKAIQASPLDSRREMWRSIYLSGGATVLPGFAARLQAELSKIAPPSIVVQVHASPQRYHAAYIGACTLASLPPFERSCITSEEWNKQGAKTLKKWHMY